MLVLEGPNAQLFCDHSAKLRLELFSSKNISGYISELFGSGRDFVIFIIGQLNICAKKDVI